MVENKNQEIEKAQEWLDKEYPKNGAYEGDNDNKGKKREEITELNLSGWNEKEWKEKPNWTKLTDSLDLSDFPNLEKLDCSYNQITSLNLSNCPNLTELKCWGNQLTVINFSSDSQLKLKTLYTWTNNLTELDWNTFNPNNLTNISISNNNLSKQNIEVFSKFTNLEELCVGNDIEERVIQKRINHFHGSLEPLKNLTKLIKLQIERTEVKEDFEHLPKDLKVVCWGKTEIIEQLGLNKEDKEKLLQAKNNFSEVLSEIISNYAKRRLGYDLTSRQKDQIGKLKLGNAVAIDKDFKELKKMLAEIKDDMIVKVIPLERLYVIRGNIKQFNTKWGGKQKINNLSEITKLQSLEEINNGWLTSRKSIYTVQFLGRSLAAGGIVLSFQGYSNEGAGILGIYPFAELLASNMEKSREDRKSKWNEFLADADNFLDNYNELLGLVDQFKVEGKSEGVVDTTLRNLNDKIKEFLAVYDSDGNREVDINELISKRSILFKDLRKEKIYLFQKTTLLKLR